MVKLDDKNIVICGGYCGVACIDGTCPIALIDEYIERCYDVVRECIDCHKYRGCEDCAFADTDLCVKNS